MRYGVIADVHGNLHALTAVVTALRRLGAEGWICAGDIVGYGPHPNECVEMVANLGALAVAGNHELVATGALTGATRNHLVRDSHRWTRSVLHDDVLAHLEALPRIAEHDRIVVAHGSLNDPEEYVSNASAASAQLEQMRREHPHAQVLVLGHTHRQQLYVDGLETVRRWPGTKALDLPTEQLLSSIRGAWASLAGGRRHLSPEQPCSTRRASSLRRYGCVMTSGEPGTLQERTV